MNERCKQLVEIIAGLYPDRVISDTDLVCLIQRYIGADKETIRAYKGYLGHIRAGRCGDNRVVGLSRKGYLEKFGYLRKIPGHKWVICQTALFSHKGMTVDYGGSGSKEKISFSKGNMGHVEKQPNPLAGREANRRLVEEEDTEKERKFTPKIYENELRVFNAVPFTEPDRTKTNLRKASKNG